MQREVIKAMSEMSENLSRISIQVAPSVQATPAMQVAMDLQLNGYARWMHRIEATLQGLTAGPESNCQEIDSVKVCVLKSKLIKKLKNRAENEAT